MRLPPFTFHGQRRQPIKRSCDCEGCEGYAQYPAPKDRHQPTSYLWFCLEHVRAYNARWNYYQGMSVGEIEHHRRADITWERPTWPLGKLKSMADIIKKQAFSDPFGFFKPSISAGYHPQPEAVLFSPESPEMEALFVLGLGQPTTFLTIKRTYKKLVKRYHPDMNQGCKRAEEQFKKINSAYMFLKKVLNTK